MSVILDALKKLDREKSSRRPGTANIAAEILRPGLSRPARRFPRSLAIVFLTAAIAAVVTYGVVEYRFKPQRTIDKAPSPSPVSSKSPNPETVDPSAPARQTRPEPLNSGSPAAAPATVRPPLHGQPQAKPASPVPLPEGRDEISRVSPKVESAPEIRTVPPSPPSPSSMDGKEAVQGAVSVRPNGAPQTTEQPVEKLPAAELPASPPSLKLSAIVWHEEPSKRIAMINGALSTEGSLVEGVKVEEILPNGVRLFYNGRYFEIPLK